MPPQYVRAYVKRRKTTRADAEAICEAVMRPNDASPADEGARISKQR